MRIFEKPNLHGNWKCPICGTAKESPVVLIGIDGTENGNIMKAEQIHLDCIELSWNKQVGVIYQHIRE